MMDDADFGTLVRSTSTVSVEPLVDEHCHDEDFVPFYQMAGYCAHHLPPLLVLPGSSTLLAQTDLVTYWHCLKWNRKIVK